MFESFLNYEALIALVSLVILEIVLGIDNLIFLAIITNKLPENQRQKARIYGLSLAILTRLLLLSTLFIIAKLTSPLFSVFSHEISGRDIILILGGLFLIVKSTLEIHHDTQPNKEQPSTDTSDTSMIIGKNFFYVLMQIALLDVVFSLDSVITAVGMVDNLQVMILAIIIAILLMIIASKKISEFIENNPSIKILALAFLILVGTSLVAEGLEFHIPKGYIYCSMAFSFSVEAINIYKRRQIRA